MVFFIDTKAIHNSGMQGREAMRHAVGLDFGTTNSAIAVAASDGATQLAAFESEGQRTTTFRSVLYFFHPKDEDADGRQVVTGPEAIPAYREAEPRGRFIQSMKSFGARSGRTRSGSALRDLRWRAPMAVQVVTQLAAARFWARSQAGDVHISLAWAEHENGTAVIRLA